MIKKAAFVCAIAVTILLLFVLLPEKKSEMSFTGMGTVITVKLYDAENGDMGALADLFTEIESATSLKKAGSALNGLNASGQTDNEYVYEQAVCCGDVFKTSGGALDATVGAVTKLWGIGTENARVPEENEILDALASVNGALLNAENGTVTLQKGQIADFGAIGKGYACDKAKEYLDSAKVKKAVISVGGSLLFYGKNDWTAAVRDPFATDGYAGTFKIKEGFVSTSGSYERYFTKNGKKYHHIIDPKTGYPAESDLISVTVCADSGALSDALSTACFVLGREKGQELLEKYGAKGIFICTDGTVYTDIDFEITSERLKINDEER